MINFTKRWSCLNNYPSKLWQILCWCRQGLVKMVHFKRNKLKSPQLFSWLWCRKKHNLPPNSKIVLKIQTFYSWDVPKLPSSAFMKSFGKVNLSGKSHACMMNINNFNLVWENRLNLHYITKIKLVSMWWTMVFLKYQSLKFMVVDLFSYIFPHFTP